MYTNIMKRTVNLLLAFSFILSMFPMTVLAEETDTRTVITEKESQTTHTVTFNAGTRASFDNATVNDGDAVSKPYEGGYKVDGWNITGWFTEPELENVYTFGDPVTTDLNLYAKWNGTAYIYTYDLTNDTQKTNTCGTVSMTGYSGKYYNHALGSCAENEEYTATANPAEGYKFKEWRIGSPNATSAGTESTYTFKLTDSSSIVIYAVFEEDVAPTVYNLWIGDTQVTSANASDILEDGKISYDVATNTLTLNGATITGGGNEDQGYGIKYQGNTDLTIVANGTNTISDNGTRKTGSAGILLGGNMGEYYGETYTRSEYKANLILNIDEGATLTINGGTATGGYYPTSYGICMWQDEGNVTINGAGTLNVNGGNANYSYGMVPANKLVFDMTGKATITGADSDYWSCGISANDIYFTNGTIEVNSGSAMQSYAITTENGMFYDAGDISIDNADVTVVSGTVPTNKDGSGKSYGIFAGRNFVIDGGSLLVKSSETGDVTMALNKAPELGIEGIVGASEASTGKNLVVYVEDNNDSYKYFKVPCEGYTVAYDVNGGTVHGGELTTRTVISGDTFTITKLFQMPDEDYHITVHAPENKWFDAFEISGERYEEGAKITITGNTVIKYLWKDITYVDKVELTIEAPVVGTKIEGEYDEVLKHIAHESINVRPVITVPEGADYAIESGETYWAASGDYNTYVGEIEAGKTYNAVVYVYCEDESYQFLEEGLEVVVNGEKATTFDSQGFWVTVEYPMESVSQYLLKANVGEGVGNISVVPSGDEPDFEYPTTSVAYKENGGTKWLLAAKPNEDYRFVNWTKSGDDSFTDTNPQITIELTEDVEYLANFELIEYNVTYDANGGTGTMSGETSKYYIFPSCEFTAPEGKTFNKWEVNGKTYKVGDTLTLTEDITVEATWKNKSTSSASSSGGGGGSSSSSYKITTKIENGTITPANTSVKKNADQEFTFKANEGYEITDVLVDGKSVGAVDKYTLDNVKEKHSIEVKTQIISALVNVDEWAKEEMSKAEELRLIPETFNKKDASKEISRADFCAVAVELYAAIVKNTVQVPENNPFTDTNDPYVLKAYSLGITKGISSTEFGNGTITREQMATMVDRALRKAGINITIDLENVTKFDDDNEMHDWGRPSIYAMAKEEIIKGVGNNKYNPLGVAKVEEALAIALRSVEIFGK